MRCSLNDSIGELEIIRDNIQIHKDDTNAVCFYLDEITRILNSMSDDFKKEHSSEISFVVLQCVDEVVSHMHDTWTAQIIECSKELENGKK